jgi:hypothetical protein
MAVVGRSRKASRSIHQVDPGDGVGWERLVSEPGALLFVAGLALAIRLYLSLTSYCISGDGVAYVAMAHHFADGDWRAALGAVFSPLYPALIALMHPWIASWEMAGNLVSATLGTAAVASTYLMTREAFHRRDLALGGAILLALHPEIAAYSASVRTEAGYIFLTTAACWLLLKALEEHRMADAALSGIAAGLSYLYRTEGIGLLPLGLIAFLAASVLWKQASYRRALAAACAFAVPFIIIAAPYLAYLRIAMGRWSIGREFTAAMMYGMGDVTSNGGEWRRLGWSTTASPLMAVWQVPRLYVEKVGQSLIISSYNFAQALGPLLTLMLAVGIWTRRRALFSRLPETFLAAIVLFYFCGFALSYTGTRFMVHLIPFTFGWVTAGIIAVAERGAQYAPPQSRNMVRASVPIAIALSLLPRTLWPIGYDMRGLRYAGEDIVQMTRRPVTVAARDGRVAYYANARFIELPPSPPEDLCGWLRSSRGDFLMVGNHDERRFGVAHAVQCLRFLKRYPRYNPGYYDLYAVKQPDQDGRSGRSGGEIQAP